MTLRARPVITWPTPADIVYGQMLGPDQLNATTSVAGSFAYTPAAGFVGNAGAGQLLSVHFTPSDTANYNDAADTALLTIRPAPLTITANDQSMLLNGSLPVFTASYAGFVNGDAPASLDTPASLSTAATGTLVGAFPIDASSATDRNHAITFVAGTLRVHYSTAPVSAQPATWCSRLWRQTAAACSRRTERCP